MRLTEGGCSYLDVPTTAKPKGFLHLFKFGLVIVTEPSVKLARLVREV